MWDIDAICAMIDKYHSFEIHTSTANECNTLIYELRQMGFTGGFFMEADRDYIPFPYFRIRASSFGGNHEWRDDNKPHFEYKDFVAQFKMDWIPEEDVPSMYSII